MSRSSKKGPYIDERLTKKIMKQKATGDKTPIKTWARDSQIPRILLAILFQCITVNLLKMYLLLNLWWDTDWENFLRLEHSEGMAGWLRG